MKNLDLKSVESGYNPLKTISIEQLSKMNEEHLGDIGSLDVLDQSPLEYNQSNWSIKESVTTFSYEQYKEDIRKSENKVDKNEI